tara:strand:+ start:271 stop:945 length:675 start_codon:yes stop_codon:yes gene_type:complete
MKFNFNIILLGAGDSSVEIVDYILSDKKFNINKYFLKVFDDNFKNKKYFKKLNDRVKLEKINNLKFVKNTNTKALITFGKPELRRKYKSIISKKKIKLFKFIHSSSHVSESAKIGIGSVICPMCVIGSFAQIKANTYVNSGALIGHHSIIGINSVISPNSFFGGNTFLGKNGFVGASSIIYPKTKILNDCKIAAGSSVTKNVDTKSFVYGNPAKIVKNYNTHKI